MIVCVLPQRCYFSRLNREYGKGAKPLARCVAHTPTRVINASVENWRR